MATRGSGSSSKNSEPQETEAKVEDYPERPYSEAVSDEHRKFLKDAGIPVESQTAEVPAE